MNTIDYLRIAVTDRCNLRCVYCMPEEGIELKSHEEMLSLEELETLVKGAARIGIKKIRLTGGEPLVRKNIVDLVRRIKAVPGIEQVTMTTNGILLGSMAEDLKKAGLDRVNISLDTLKADRFKEITRWGNLEDVLKGIEGALAAGLTPVKLNVVAMKDFNKDEILDFVAFSREKGVQVRFIELMPIGESDEEAFKKHLSIDEIRGMIEEKYTLEESHIIKTNGPSKNYDVLGGGSVGFIGALSNHFCGSCNRLRVTADGKVRLCLHKDIEFDILSLLREGKDEVAIGDYILSLLPMKPEGHNMAEEGWGKQKRKMSQIGG